MTRGALRRRTAVHEGFKLSLFEKISTIWGCLLGYASFCADIAAGENYNSHSDVWWFRWTLYFAFLPGLIHCFVQHFTFYKKPAHENYIGLRVGEAPPKFKRRRQWAVDWIGVYLLNLFQFRLFYETWRSFSWQFQTGAWRDSRVLQVIFSSFPQTCLQAYIIFRQWNENVSFSFTPTFVSIALALGNICFVPSESPCFEDNERLTRLSGMDIDEFVTSDEETESDEDPDAWLEDD